MSQRKMEELTTDKLDLSQFKGRKEKGLKELDLKLLDSIVFTQKCLDSCDNGKVLVVFNPEGTTFQLEETERLSNYYRQQHQIEKKFALFVPIEKQWVLIYCNDNKIEKRSISDFLEIYRLMVAGAIYPGDLP